MRPPINLPAAVYIYREHREALQAAYERYLSEGDRMEPLTQLSCLNELSRLHEAGVATGGPSGLGDCVLFYSPDLNETMRTVLDVPPERTLARRLSNTERPSSSAIYPVLVPNWPVNTWRIQMLDFNPKGTE